MEYLSLYVATLQAEHWEHKLITLEHSQTQK